MQSPFGCISTAEFLQEYWQKKPLYIPKALKSPAIIEPDIIAGYCLEDDVESRIILETIPASGDRLSSAWSLHHGPFTEDSFATLPSNNWTILVQAADQLNPDLHALRNQFSFIPNWRIDDIMVSFATDGGNVGPHFDYYDVFLIQAQGKRKWRLGQHCDSSTPLRHDTDCKILESFHAKQEWLVEPGDLLYIPPGIAHWGIAEGDCTTYSVGFRAPSETEILLELGQEWSTGRMADQRYRDNRTNSNIHPGEIRLDDIKPIQEMLLNLANDESALLDWFGRYMTQAKRNSLCYTPEKAYCRTPSARFSYYRNTDDANESTLFVNGNRYICTLDFAKRLCHPDLEPIATSHIKNDKDKKLLEIFIEQGVIIHLTD